ncbi:polyprenyl synthetase family protein, partial [Acinetobacter baumannii]
GGARIRPKLTLAVASACGEDDPGLTDGVAAAIELLHCASLVHDDLPCFDAAETRRGQPSVHCAFGERLAVLAGDALIVTAFEVLGAAARRHP